MALPPDVQKLAELAHSARLNGNYAQAASYFQQAGNTLAKLPAFKSDATAGNAWAALCRGLAALFGLEGQAGAGPHLESAAQSFSSINDFDGRSRCEAALAYCDGMEATEDVAFDSAIEHYGRSKAILLTLADRVGPQESPQLRQFVLEIDFDIAVCGVIEDVLEKDYDGARASLADVRRAHGAIVQNTVIPAVKLYYDGNLTFIQGLTSYIRGKQSLALIRLSDAKKCFSEAQSKAQEACQIASQIIQKPPRWISTEHLYRAILLECKARIQHSEVLEKILAGDLENAPKELRETAALYDVSAEVFSNVGMNGYGGLYAMGGERDALLEMAATIERRPIQHVKHQNDRSPSAGPARRTSPFELVKHERVNSFIFWCDVVSFSRSDIQDQLTIIKTLYERIAACKTLRGSSVPDFVFIPTGDGCGIVFLEGDSCTPLSLAIELQSDLRASPPNPPFFIRSAVHSGDNFLTTDAAGSRNIIGANVNYAARITDLAGAGQILSSESYYQLFVDKNREFNSFSKKLGTFEVKHNEPIPIVTYLQPGVFGSDALPRKRPPQPSTGP